MKLINDNLKKAGYFNAVLIAIAIVLRLINFKDISLYAKIDAAVCVISLLFGLLYSINGYSKDVAKDYKMFMLFYAISAMVSIIVPVLDLLNVGIGSLKFVSVAIDAITTTCAFMLAFGKDLGYEKSIKYVTLALSVSIIKLLLNIVKLDFTHSIPSSAHLIQAIIAYVFVSAKYKDKEARGTK